MADPAAARPAAEAMAATLPRLLASVEDGRARRLLGRLLPRMAGGPGGARILARALRAWSTAASTTRSSTWRSPAPRHPGDQGGPVEDRHRVPGPGEGGALVGWLAGAAVARRVLADGQCRTGEDGALRQRPARRLRGLAAGRDRPAGDRSGTRRRGRPGAAPGDFAPDGACLDRGYLGPAEAALVADAANPQGRTVALLEGAFANAGACWNTTRRRGRS